MRAQPARPERTIVRSMTSSPTVAVPLARVPNAAELVVSGEGHQFHVFINELVQDRGAVASARSLGRDGSRRGRECYRGRCFSHSPRWLAASGSPWRSSSTASASPPACGSEVSRDCSAANTTAPRRPRAAARGPAGRRTAPRRPEKVRDQRQPAPVRPAARGPVALGARARCWPRLRASGCRSGGHRSKRGDVSDNDRPGCGRGRSPVVV